MLTIGMVPALFDEEGKKAIVENIRDEAKKKGVPESKDDLWNYFMEKIRDNLHIVLAMSPAGENLRIRCRNFPGLISNTCIDWFFNWPEEALTSVATFYLQEQDLPNENRKSITDHIVLVHTSVQEFSKEFEQQLKRKNFSTPKNYLDFLNNYSKLLNINRKKFTQVVGRYESGLTKLSDASEQVKVLQADLEIKQVEVKEQKGEVESLIEDIKNKTEIASKHQEVAVDKKTQLDIDEKVISKEQQRADEILKESEPILEKAQISLNKIKQKDLDFLKSLANPKDAIKTVAQMVLVLKPLEGFDESGGWASARVKK